MMAKGAGDALYRSFPNLRGLPRMFTGLPSTSPLDLVSRLSLLLYSYILFSLLEHPVEFYRSTDRLLQQLVQDVVTLQEYPAILATKGK